jgi:hypothetical protein
MCRESAAAGAHSDGDGAVGLAPCLPPAHPSYFGNNTVLPSTPIRWPDNMDAVWGTCEACGHSDAHLLGQCTTGSATVATWQGPRCVALCSCGTAGSVPLLSSMRNTAHCCCCRCLWCSWLKKLDVAKQLLVDDLAVVRPGEEALAAAYIYLHWISTGSLACVEGGSHHRPNHHAELGRMIFRAIEWVLAETEPEDPISCRRRCIIARRLHTKCATPAPRVAAQVGIVP